MKIILNVRMQVNRILFLILVCLNSGSLFAQSETIDKIVAVVGDKAILLSDIEAQALQVEQQSGNPDPYLRCNILEDMIIQKLLLNQAEKDSVVVSDDQVDGELNKKIRYFVGQIGSVEKLEAYLGKSIVQIKDDFRERIRDQLVVQQMQGKIAGDVKVSPAEVRAYYDAIPKDSVPFIESEIQVAQILKKPPINQVERERVRKELQEIRQKIVDGRSFASMAAFYSEDVVSAAKGGELGFVNRGDLVPEFEAVAFSLKGKEISEIVETMFGFHIIQLIERRGETINVRHILISPKASASDLDVARVKLDSISQAIRLGRISFEEAALKYSDDADTKNNGGLMINPNSGSTWFEVSQMDQSIFFVVDKMKIGELSDPVTVRVGEKKESYRIVSLKARTEPHRANLKDDYQRIQQAAEAEKKSKLVQEWIQRKRQSFFIKIDAEFSNCHFQNTWNN
ncbi:MAG TPA: peptidylprolyl isomerase [Flavobacteriales bacterium]|nr:peptidylprolyl isomerase [Flavobacteriales bacterium]